MQTAQGKSIPGAAADLAVEVTALLREGRGVGRELTSSAGREHAHESKSVAVPETTCCQEFGFQKGGQGVGRSLQLLLRRRVFLASVMALVPENQGRSG